MNLIDIFKLACSKTYKNNIVIKSIMKINIVGWSGVNHSYSIIAETYMRGLSEMPNVELYFTPHEYYNQKWKKCRETFFDALPKPSQTDEFDITLRFTYPYEMIPDPHAKITIVFMTCEFNYVSDFVDTYDICDNVFILTPSIYSKQRIVASGFDDNKIIVVNHCYDYIESPLSKQQLREKYNIPINDYVYFHNSALTPNKNVPMLLNCFERIYEGDDNITLIIKGVDNIYNSKNKLMEIIYEIKSKNNFLCEQKIKYFGGEVSNEIMCEYYKLSDCYVSPFLAEGFNLPVLEALCHGLQVICTQGGPPDEFAKDAYFIPSSLKPSGDSLIVNGNNVTKLFLYPSESELFKFMLLIPMIENRIDKNYYCQKYSQNTIKHILHDELIKLSKQQFNIPKILLLDTEKINLLILNLRKFINNEIIYVGVLNNVRYIQDTNNVVLIELQTNTHDKTKIMKLMMDKLKLSEGIYVDENAILYCDPRNIFKHESKQDNIIINNNNEIVMMCIKNSNTFRRIEVPTIQTCLNNPHKFIVKKDNVKILYELNNNRYVKVPIVANYTSEDMTQYYLEIVNTKLTLIKVLQDSDIAILTNDIKDKYTNIFRCAPLTLLFDGNEKQVDIIDCDGLSKENIFVYPEVFDFFFSVLYCHINHPFKLYSDKCEFVETKQYIKWDTKKLITSCIYPE